MRDLLRQMLLALSALQQANVTHRDVKPENVLLSEVPAMPPAGGGGDASVPDNSSITSSIRRFEGPDAAPSTDDAGARGGYPGGCTSRPNPTHQHVCHVQNASLASLRTASCSISYSC